MVAIFAEFDQYLHAPVLMPSVTLCRIGLPTNYHHPLQETWHVSSPFITTGPGTDSASPGDIKLPKWSCPVFFVNHSHSKCYYIH